jgi:hypothetical protein
VWRVSPSGIINTAAGGGVSSADGVQATSAQLFPSGVVADSAGNLYISGNVLRKVTPAGIISTVAQVNGGNVAVDGAGNLYVADILHCKIVKVDQSGNITTLVGDAGNGFSGDGGPAVNARVSLPQGVAADSAGNIYFCDAGNSRVRKIDTSGIMGSRGACEPFPYPRGSRWRSMRGLRRRALSMVGSSALCTATTKCAAAR